MNENDRVLTVSHLSLHRQSAYIFKDLSFSLEKGDHLAITGAAGTGKTSLALALAGKAFFEGEISYAGQLRDGVVYVGQEHHFKNLSNTASFYYQQRFNSMDAEDAPTVKDYLGELQPVMELRVAFRIDQLADKPLIQLSNGENKKVQLVRALMESPSVLILDQPFVGLDVETRAFLHDRINELAEKGMLIILVTHPSEIPACITQVVSLQKELPPAFFSREQFGLWQQTVSGQGPRPVNQELLERLMNKAAVPAGIPVIQMKDVSISYGDKQVLSGINWEVASGERWLLSGPNGAGKSTLLSLITADNPQAYANEIYLFGRKRGTGETIWEVKKNIGYLSPEMLLYFDVSNTVFEATASGLFDTIGLFRQLSDELVALVYDWLELVGIRSLARKRLNELSTGEQRKALLARALIKNPPLLILDELCQGLDEDTEAELLELIDRLCNAGSRTLIYVTHYARNRPACITRGLVLENGKVVRCGEL